MLELKPELRGQILSLLEGIDAGHLDPQELLARVLGTGVIREHIVDVSFEIAFPISKEIVKAD